MTRSTILLALAGCGSSAARDPDAGPIDTTPDAPAVECVPLSHCTWLEAYQREIVGALAGAIEIAPGVTLAHRASVAERDAARSYLIAAFETLDIPVARHDYATGANVIATLPSTTGAGSTIVVGAHFDGVPEGPAAADNATGVAIVLATARYLRDVPVREHPIVFALFDEEELGLIGSKAYVPTLATTEVASVHIFDMLSFDGDGDHAVELWSPAPAIAAAYQQYGAVAGMPISVVTFAYSDHQAFIDAGLPATGVGEEFVAKDHTPHYHKATDVFENVSFDHLSRVTHLAWTVLEAEVRAP